MLWSRSTSPTVQAAPAAVPDAQALRRAALQASWQRDRRVGQRRLALRWLVWALRRFGVPVVLALAAAGAVWLWLQPNTHAARDATIQSPPRTAEPPKAVNPLIQEAIRLRMEPVWLPRGAAAPVSPTPPAATEDASEPQLKPDHWLHSKEP